MFGSSENRLEELAAIRIKMLIACINADGVSQSVEFSKRITQNWALGQDLSFVGAIIKRAKAAKQRLTPCLKTAIMQLFSQIFRSRVDM
jgi:hypothetical protein